MRFERGVAKHVPADRPGSSHFNAASHINAARVGSSRQAARHPVPELCRRMAVGLSQR